MGKRLFMIPLNMYSSLWLVEEKDVMLDDAEEPEIDNLLNWSNLPFLESYALKVPEMILFYLLKT